MSTENIADRVDAAREALGRADAAAKHRLKDVRKQRRGLEVERQRAAEGYRLTLQRLSDLDEVLAEEETQLTGRVETEERAEGEGSEERTAPPQPEPEPEEEPPPPEPPVEPPAPPEPPDTAPTEEQPAQVVQHVHVLNVRHWTTTQWLFAIALALVGLVVAATTDQWLVDDVQGFGRGFVTFLWWTGLVTVGLGFGGLVGWYFDLLREKDG